MHSSVYQLPNWFRNTTSIRDLDRCLFEGPCLRGFESMFYKIWTCQRDFRIGRCCLRTVRARFSRSCSLDRAVTVATTPVMEIVPWNLLCKGFCDICSENVMVDVLSKLLSMFPFEGMRCLMQQFAGCYLTSFMVRVELCDVDRPYTLINVLATWVFRNVSRKDRCDRKSIVKSVVPDGPKLWLQVGER